MSADNVVTIRFGSWNLAGGKLSAKIADLAAAHDVDVLAVQELTREGHDRLSRSGWFTESAYSLDLRPPEKGEGLVRALGCGLLIRPPWRIVAQRLLETPLRERSLIGELLHDETGLRLTAGSFHAPPGVTHKEKKPETFLRIAEWLATEARPVVMGMDCNTPRWDRPDLDQTEWHWKDEAALLGVDVKHGLRDAFRVYLEDHPEVFRAVRALRPEGPLEVSFVRGPGRHRYLCRYDHILISGDFRPASVRYLYNASVAAGSDHSLVVADLRIASAGRQPKELENEP